MEVLVEFALAFNTGLDFTFEFGLQFGEHFGKLGIHQHFNECNLIQIE